MRTKQKQKIVYLITKSNWGGAQRYVYDLAVHNKDAYDVVVAFGGTGILQQKLEAAGIRTISIPNLERDVHAWKEFSVFGHLVHLFKTERPDIVHLNSSKIGGLGAVAARFAGLLFRRPTPFKPRIIFTAHGWPFKEERPPRERFFIRFASYISVLCAHATIVVSDDDKLWSEWMPFVQHKIFTVHNGIDAGTLLPRDEARRILGEKSGVLLAADAFVIGTIAELHHNKGLVYALRAFDDIAVQYPQTMLCIIGDGEDRAHMEELILMKELTGRVALAGYVDNATSFLSAFDMFTLPSIKEGLPYTILEAGAAGLPVVATAVGGVLEIIDDMQSGIVVRPKNHSELSGAWAMFLDHEDKQKEYGATLQKKVLKKFSLSGMARKTLAIYKGQQV